MQKINNWLKRQSKQSKAIFLITLCLFLIFSIYKTPFYLFTEYGFDAFVGRLFGTFLGILTPLLVASLVVALFPYLVFRKVAEKYKKYFDYFSIIFLIIAIICLWINLSHSILRIF